MSGIPRTTEVVRLPVLCICCSVQVFRLPYTLTLLLFMYHNSLFKWNVCILFSCLSVTSDDCPQCLLPVKVAVPPPAHSH